MYTVYIYIYVYIQQLETTDIWDIYPLLRKIVKIHVTPPGDPRRLHPRCHPDWECPLPAWAVTCRILPVKNLKMAIDLAKMRIIPDNPEFSILIRLLGTQSFCHMGQFPCHAWVLSSTELPSSFWYLQNLEGSNEASWCLECIPRDILQEGKNHITSHDTCCLWIYPVFSVVVFHVTQQIHTSPEPPYFTIFCPHGAVGGTVHDSSGDTLRVREHVHVEGRNLMAPKTLFGLFVWRCLVECKHHAIIQVGIYWWWKVSAPACEQT